MRILLGVLAVLPMTVTHQSFAAEPSGVLGRIGHVIVIFLENRNFDNLYGLFPVADGIGNAGPAAMQVMPGGDRYTVLPAVLNNQAGSFAVDTRFAA